MALEKHPLVIQDENGDVVAGATITVRRESTGGIAPIFSDRLGATPLANPYVAADGADAGFYAYGDLYHILAEKDALSRTWRDVAIVAEVATSGDAADLTGTLPAERLGPVTVTDQPHKSSPSAAADYMILFDAAGNEIAKATVGEVVSAGAAAINGAFGYRNRLVNPSGVIWQVQNTGAAALTDGTYAWDQWYALTQSNGVTGSQVTDAEDTTPHLMRLLQANASAQRMGLAQHIESLNAKDMRGQSVALSARVRLSTSANIRFAIIEWTGTADAPTKDFVNNWASGTYTTGNFFISTTTTVVAVGSAALTANTFADISLTGTVSSSLNNLAVFIWTEATVAQNVTLDIGKVQLERSTVVSPFAKRSIQEELLLAQRYYEKSYELTTAPGTVTTTGQFRFRPSSSSTILAASVQFQVRKMKSPTVTIYNPSSGASGSVRDLSAGANVTVSTVDAVSTKGFGSITGSGSFTDANLNDFHYVSDARM